MSNPFECPGCHVQLAYSAALRGRTVRCHHCGHSFPVADLLEAVVLPEPTSAAAPTVESQLIPPPLPRPLNPPPLPVRTSRGRTESTLDEGTSIAVADEPRSPEFVEEAVAGAPDELSESRERPATIAPVAGLIGVLLFGGFVLASGIGYLVWPGSSRTTAPAIPAAAPPAETPVEIDQPKSLKEVLEGGGNELPPKVNPGVPAPKFPQRK
jgi:hypothetical protein